MVLFYDPRDEEDLNRIVQLLREHGIEHTLRPETVDKIGPAQIHVAEEDLPRAEELLVQSQIRKD